MVFSLAENQSKETFKNNENVLWLDGKATPLPPIRITIPQGIEEDWVIQDTEGMVDLVFTPQRLIRNSLNTMIFNTEYVTPLGYYNGKLLTSDGTQLLIHNDWGLGERLFLRI